MKRLSIICLFLLAWAGTLFAQTLKSPDGILTLQFRLSAEGIPVYSLQYKGKEVIKECRISVERGTVYGFLGKNGAGKTTMFKLLLGFLLRMCSPISDR